MEKWTAAKILFLFSEFNFLFHIDTFLDKNYTMYQKTETCYFTDQQSNCSCYVFYAANIFCRPLIRYDILCCSLTGTVLSLIVALGTCRRRKKQKNADYLTAYFSFIKTLIKRFSWVLSWTKIFLPSYFISFLGKDGIFNGLWLVEIRCVCGLNSWSNIFPKMVTKFSARYSINVEERK